MNENQEPFEIIAGPFEVYAALVGTAFPAIKDAPAAPWKLIGKNGNANHDEGAVKVSHKQATDKVYVAGRTSPRKVLRKQEEMHVIFDLLDLTIEAYAQALGGLGISTVAAAAGVAGEKSMGLSMGGDVTQVSILVRGLSPYGTGMAMQYELPIASQVGDPAPVPQKGKPAGLAFDYLVLDDPNAVDEYHRHGTLRGQTAAAL